MHSLAALILVSSPSVVVCAAVVVPPPRRITRGRATLGDHHGLVQRPLQGLVSVGRLPLCRQALRHLLGLDADVVNLFLAGGLFTGVQRVVETWMGEAHV